MRNGKYLKLVSEIKVVRAQEVQPICYAIHPGILLGQFQPREAVVNADHMPAALCHHPFYFYLGPSTIHPGTFSGRSHAILILTDTCFLRRTMKLSFGR